MGGKATIAFLLFCSVSAIVLAEDPYRFLTWNITYGDIWPLGVKQQVRNLDRSLSSPLVFLCSDLARSFVKFSFHSFLFLLRSFLSQI